MPYWWVKFKDGKAGCVQAFTREHATKLAEYLVSSRSAPGRADVEWVDILPYPASPVLWEYSDPVTPPCPAFCYTPEQCRGKGSCPKERACND